MSNNTTMKYACEQFDGKTNFGIWQSTVKDILVQQGLLKPLLGNKPESMDQDDWEELQAKAVSTIRGRSRSRNSGHGNDRSKSRGKQNKSSIECWYCKEIAHIARKCPERKDKKNGKKHVNNANVAEEDDKSSDGDLYLVSSVEQQEATRSIAGNKFLKKLIKYASWRNHSKLAHRPESVIDRLTSSASEKPATPPLPSTQLTILEPIINADGAAADTLSLPGVLAGHLSLANSEFILGPIIDAAASNNLKIAAHLPRLPPRRGRSRCQF
ncbi:hypothetical protein RJ640_023709 [Escallonia rubra]|uniref:CCHC-type domain-containing protein n=1 Tax=Escallonia rubra TaxID=112253 RepID=A0AA88UDY5_9ASTE|nr:hypothetical protein RJ640_023709 [Escallonia rubra]